MCWVLGPGLVAPVPLASEIVPFSLHSLLPFPEKLTEKLEPEDWRNKANNPRALKTDPPGS